MNRQTKHPTLGGADFRHIFGRKSRGNCRRRLRVERYSRRDRRQRQDGATPCQPRDGYRAYCRLRSRQRYYEALSGRTIKT